MNALLRLIMPLLVGVVISWPAFAKSIVVEVPLSVDGHAIGEDEAFMRGWQQAAIRLGGDNDKAARARPSDVRRHILQYRYQRVGNESVLRVVFDAPSTNQALHQLGALSSIKWPTLVAWVAKADEKKETLIDADDVVFKRSLEQATQKLPLKVFLPAFDLDEQYQISFSDLWQDRLKKLNQHSKRYHVDGIVVIKLSPLSDKRYQSQWTLSYQGRRQVFTTKPSDMSALLHDGFEQLADLMKKNQKAIAPYDVYLSISGLTSFTDTKTYQQYFKALPGIIDASIDGVTPKGVLYKLRVSISKEALGREIAREGRLQEQASRNKAVLSYHKL